MMITVKKNLIPSFDIKMKRGKEQGEKKINLFLLTIYQIRFSEKNQLTV